MNKIHSERLFAEVRMDLIIAQVHISLFVVYLKF